MEKIPTLVKTSLLSMVFTISGCKGEKVDLAQYLIPSEYYGNVLAIYGDLVLNKLDFEDAVTITEYSKGTVSSDRYKIFTDQTMKVYGLKSKKQYDWSVNTRYVFDEK